MRQPIKKSKRSVESKWEENTTHIFHCSKCGSAVRTQHTLADRQTGSEGRAAREADARENCTEMFVVLLGWWWGLNMSWVSADCQGLEKQHRETSLWLTTKSVFSAALESFIQSQCALEKLKKLGKKKLHKASLQLSFKYSELSLVPFCSSCSQLSCLYISTSGWCKTCRSKGLNSPHCTLYLD